MHTLRVLASSALLVACTPKPADTDGESSSSVADTDGAEATSATAATTGSTTSGTATTPTTGGDPSATTVQTDPGATDGDGGSTTSPGATSIVTTGASTGPDPSTSTGGDTEGGGLPGACAAVCAHWDMCAPGQVGPVEQCTASCSNGSQEPPGCAEAMAVKLACVAMLSCEEALKFLDGEPTSCLEEANAAGEVCAGLDCGGEVGGDMESCELQQDCNGLKQQYICDGETCTCVENDVPGEQCPSEEFCALDFLEKRQVISQCCGWEWEV